MQNQDLEKQYPVVLEQSVVWGDMDVFHHVNNTVYFRYFEDARIAYFEKVGVSGDKKTSHIGPILASTRCDFRLPLSYPDTIKIVAWVEDVKEKRFTMKYKVFSEKLAALAAEGEGLVVFYNYDQGKSCAIPESIKQTMAELDKSA